MERIWRLQPPQPILVIDLFPELLDALLRTKLPSRLHPRMPPCRGCQDSRLPAVARLENRARVVHEHLLDVLLRDPSRAEGGQDVIGDVRVVPVRPCPALVL